MHSCIADHWRNIFSRIREIICIHIHRIYIYQTLKINYMSCQKNKCFFDGLQVKWSQYYQRGTSTTITEWRFKKSAPSHPWALPSFEERAEEEQFETFKQMETKRSWRKRKKQQHKGRRWKESMQLSLSSVNVSSRKIEGWTLLSSIRLEARSTEGDR